MKNALRSGLFASKKLTVLKNLCVVLLSVLFTSCSAKKTESETVIIRGSNTIGEELAPRLIEEFKKEHPAVVFDTEFKGSSYGLGALMVERCDIAAASRDLTTNEMELAKDRDIQFNNYVIGSYSVVVVVNTNNTLANLTQNQIRDIFTGTAKNWKDVGGQDAAIHIYIRDPISGTYLGFQELAMDRKPYAGGLKTFTNYTGIIDAVAKDPAGIGYVGLELSEQKGVKTLAIGGVAPTAASINKNEYPYSRVLRLHTNKTKEKAAAKTFIDFIQSARGQAVLSELGFAPHP